MMVSLCFLTIAFLLVLYDRAERDLLEEVRRHTEDISTAIQISLEQMSRSKINADISNLKNLTTLKKKGIKEISVINNEREVVASSNAKLIGKKLNIKGETYRNTGSLTEYTTVKGSKKRYDFLLPVVVGKDRLGYIHIATEFGDFAKIAMRNHRSRLLATVVIFSIGILAAIYLSKKYTRPIQSIAEAAQEVARGNLSVKLELDEVDSEIAQLTKNFNDMVRKLGENRALQEKLKEAEHFSKIGTLASGIAHEIRNPLNFISLSIDHLMAVNAPEDPEKREKFIATVSNIKLEIQRLDGMVSNFLNFGRPLKLTFTDLQLGLIIDETAALMADTCAQQNVILSIRHQEGIKNIAGDYKHLKTCFVNVFLNAIQAMPNGGRLLAESSANNGFVSVRVEDTGAGIIPENLSRIFEPYFTTKEVGIGLGLAITKRTIEEHGGNISVSSVLNKGTAITINLPEAG